MPSPNANHLFRSQRIQQQCGSPPLLLPARQGNNFSNNENKQNIQRTEEARGEVREPYQPETSSKDAWAVKIEVNLIRSLPIYYILEPTSIAVREIPFTIVQSRILDFLRIQSISFTYHADTVRLECVTSNLLKFVIQFWRVNGEGVPALEPDQAVTVELQRRQGSSIEMQAVRRKMHRAVLTGEQATTPFYLERPQMQARNLPATIMTEVDTLSDYDHDAGRSDALHICLRLIESNCMDQARLGLESLRMLTDPSIVAPQDALFVSRAVLLRQSAFGPRLQSGLARYSFGIAEALAGRSDMAEYRQYSQAHYDGFHSLGLAILSNALQMVESNENVAIDVTDRFWELVTEDLMWNVERAVQKPNEGAVSAKCIRHLKCLGCGHGNGMDLAVAMTRPRGFRACLAEANRFGAMHHWMLEQESQKLLAMDIDTNLRAH
ncbi:expressed unknown protein [Seminavis robusta]|uniref:Uncharacterized protein n=1 Tax=Seminavis robusta TaxID=568900 RepID=A0A9N8DTK1_9STRA|nr:expressed unknown protein [Seminavis robusta]|eukprot:Sro341_g121590.1 n/a (437) ;mRNA; r:64010-65320